MHQNNVMHQTNYAGQSFIGFVFIFFKHSRIQSQVFSDDWRYLNDMMPTPIRCLF